MINCRDIHNFIYLNHYELEDGDDTEILIDIDDELFEIQSIDIEDGKVILKVDEA